MTDTESSATLRIVSRPTAVLVVLLLVSNTIPGVALYLYFRFLALPVGGKAGPTHTSHITVSSFAVFVVVALPIAGLINVRMFRPVARWVRAARRPTPSERRATLQAPLRVAISVFSYWTIGALSAGLLNALLGYPFGRVLLVVVGVLLAGVASSTLSALLTERVLRPVTATVLAGDLPSGSRGIKVLPRLLFSWAFGSAVPLVALLLVPVGEARRSLSDFTGTLVFLCVGGLASGFLITTGAARAVSEPLRAVRMALGQVEAGDLDVAVVVDDLGEVGQLQAGVNRMVEGLRQRRELEDLFGRYVGEEVAAGALERGTERSGVRAEASVLFVDLRGSTAMAEELAPEQVVAALNAYFAAVEGAVRQHGGWVNKFEGDGALCVFGPPIGRTDHAVRALRAATEIVTRVPTVAVLGVRLDAAVGVSSGAVVAGNIGSAERFEYTVVGDPVNEAARLTDLAKEHPARVLASRRVVEAAGSDYPGWQPEGAAHLRGRTAPTDLFRPPDGAIPTAATLPGRPTGGAIRPTGGVGRDGGRGQPQP